MVQPEWTSVRTEDYLRLLSSERQLRALEDMGVDNWDGYDDIDWARIDEPTWDY